MKTRIDEFVLMFREGVFAKSQGETPLSSPDEILAICALRDAFVRNPTDDEIACRLRERFPFIAIADPCSFQYAANFLESLPIDPAYSDSRIRHAIAFALCGAHWVPCSGIEINEQNGFATLRYENSPSSVDNLCCMMGKWAHCTADHRPSMPYTDDSDNYPNAQRSI